MFKSLVEAGTDGVQLDCADGFSRKVVPLVAAWLGDREEHEVIASIVKVIVCMCFITISAIIANF
jgi:hypothetical protein